MSDPRHFSFFLFVIEENFEIFISLVKFYV